jgi:hypothetical protein
VYQGKLHGFESKSIASYVSGNTNGWPSSLLAILLNPKGFICIQTETSYKAHAL